MIRKSFVLACAAAFALAACNQQPAAGPGPATGAAPDGEPAGPEAAATLIPTGPAGPADAADFDPRAFAGRFSGTLPCASCPGIDTTLQLRGDGSYTLTEQYQEREDGAFTGDGTWTAEADGTRIRLDPGSKSEEDRVYAIEAGDRLVQLDAGGEPLADADHALTRTGTAAR